MEEDAARHDPTIGVKKIRYAQNGHHTLTPVEIEQYKSCHPLGTKARPAFDPLRFTTGARMLPGLVRGTFKTAA